MNIRNKRSIFGIVAMILLLCMTVTLFSACAKEPEPGTDTDSPEKVLKLSDHLPTFTIRGNYTEGELDIEEDGEFEMLWAYDGDDDAEYRYVRAYKWAAEGLTLMEATQEDAQYYYAEQAPTVITCDFWNEPGDCEYTYYAAIDEDRMMMQVWNFQDGDSIYQICVGYDLVTYTVDGTDIRYSIPKRMKEGKSESALKAFEDPDYESDMSEFPNIEIYLSDGDFDFSAENIAKAWNVENVEVVEREYTSRSTGETLSGYCVSCEYQEDWGTLVYRQYCIPCGDQYFNMAFSYKKDIGFPEYIENSFGAFLYTVFDR